MKMKRKLVRRLLPRSCKRLTSAFTGIDRESPAALLNRSIQGSGNSRSHKEVKGGRLAGIGAQPTVREAHNLPEISDNGGAENNQVLNLSVEGEAIATPPSSAQNRETKSLKRSLPRPDPYDVPPDDCEPNERRDTENESDEPPRKRLKLSRTDPDSTTPRPGRLMNTLKLPPPSGSRRRSIYLAEGQITVLTGNLQMPNDSEITVGNNPPAKAKRGRGRPKKQNRTDATSGVIPANEPAATGAAEAGLNSHAPAVGEDAAKSNGGAESPVNVQDGNPRDIGSPPSQESDNSDYKPDDEEDIDAATSRSKSYERATPSEAYLIDPGTFDIIKDELKHVGHKFDKETKQWSQKLERPNSKTIPGKRLERLLGQLAESYCALRTSKSAGNPHAIHIARTEVMRVIEEITTKSNEIVTDRLKHTEPTTESIQKTKNFLSDLYYVLLQRFIDAIKAGTEVHTVEGPMTTIALQEIAKLLEIMKDLAEKAVDQPSNLQPKAPKNKTYHILKPIRQVLPMIRELHRKISRELSRRKRAEELARWEKVSVERERRRRQEEIEARSERQRKKIALHRLQRRVLDEKLADPLLPRWAKAEIARYKVKPESRRPQTKLNARISQSAGSRQSSIAEVYDVEEMEGPPFHDDPFDEGTDGAAFNNDGYERVKIFGKSNRQQQVPKPWSTQEKMVFIDTMRFERGNIISAVLVIHRRLTLHRRGSIPKGG